MTNAITSSNQARRDVADRVQKEILTLDVDIQARIARESSRTDGAAKRKRKNLFRFYRLG